MARQVYNARIMFSMLPEDAADLEAEAARLQIPVTVLVRQITALWLEHVRAGRAQRQMSNGVEHREIA